MIGVESNPECTTRPPCPISHPHEMSSIAQLHTYQTNNSHCTHAHTMRLLQIGSTYLLHQAVREHITTTPNYDALGWLEDHNTAMQGLIHCPLLQCWAGGPAADCSFLPTLQLAAPSAEAVKRLVHLFLCCNYGLPGHARLGKCPWCLMTHLHDSFHHKQVLHQVQPDVQG